MAMKAGHQARIRFDDSDYAVKSWQIESETTPLDCSNTEGRPGNSAAANQSAYGFAATLAGLRRARMRFTNATYDDAFPFGGPTAFTEGDYVNEIQIFPDRDNSSDYHGFASMMVTKVTMEGEVDGLQPVTFEGVSDGQYTWATES